MSVLREATKAVPAVRYAIGVAGIFSVVAIVKSFGLDPRISFFGALFIVIIMAILVVFARVASLSKGYIRLPAIVLTWFSLLALVACSTLLFTSVFFDWPTGLSHWLTGEGSVTGAVAINECHSYVLTVANEETYWAENSETATNAITIGGPSGMVEGEEPHVDGTVIVKVPNGAKLLSETFKPFPGPGWGRWYSEPPVISPDGNSISARYKNWKREGARVSASVEFRRLETRTNSQAVELANWEGERAAQLCTGEYLYSLGNDYKSFELRVTDSDSNVVTLSPAHLGQGKFSAFIEEVGGGRRLRVVINSLRSE